MFAMTMRTLYVQWGTCMITCLYIAARPAMPTYGIGGGGGGGGK